MVDIRLQKGSMPFMKYKRLLRYALAFTLLSSLTPAQAMAQTEVHILDVNQGLSVLIESDGHYMLYDGGDRDRSSFVVSYLKQQGVTSLDYMIASHYDADHIHGLVGALNTTTVNQIFAPDYTASSKVFHTFQKTAESKSIPKEQPAVGNTYSLGDAVFQILSPSSSKYDDVNDYSIGIRITDDQTSFLITGDAEYTAETEICKTGLPLDSDVYVMGHHGSGSSTSWDLLQHSTPEYAVLSCGADNSYGHPHIESMEKLQSMDIELFRTDKQGTIIASTDGKEITWNTDPCNDYSPGSKNDLPAKPSAQKPLQSGKQNASSVSVGTEYILNTSTKKFHYPNCSSAARIKKQNKKRTSANKDSLISQGYSPCGKCKP